MMSIKENIQQLREMSEYVLQATMQRTNVCLYMSALLYVLISGHLNVTPRLMTGTLTLGKRTIFSHEPIRPALTSGSDYAGEWDGHAWVEVEGYICDLSVFWTIFSAGTPPDLQALFEQTFQAQPDYLIASRKKLEEIGVFYESHEELVDADATLLIRSGFSAGFLGHNNLTV